MKEHFYNDISARFTLSAKDSLLSDSNSLFKHAAQVEGVRAWTNSLLALTNLLWHCSITMLAFSSALSVWLPRTLATLSWTVWETKGQKRNFFNCCKLWQEVVFAFSSRHKTNMQDSFVSREREEITQGQQEDNKMKNNKPFLEPCYFCREVNLTVRYIQISWQGAQNQMIVRLWQGKNGLLFNHSLLFQLRQIQKSWQPDETKKHSTAPTGIEPRILRTLVARSNHWATKPQPELCVNFRLSPSCQFFLHYEVTRIARVYKHGATNDNSLDLHHFNYKLALVGIIPNHSLLFQLRQRQKSRQPDQTKKKQRSPAGNRIQGLANAGRTL